jgi:hypothetical protein
VLLALCAPIFADDARRDGNWWREQSRLTQNNYVVGFFDGMPLGSSFSWWGMPKKDGNINPAAEVAVESFNMYFEKYFSNLTNGQVADGVTAFYEDFRNRKILMKDAVWIVVNMIAGKSEDEIKTMTESFRKNAK